MIINSLGKPNYNDLNKEFKKQMIWFHTNYMKTERENQMLWINSQISHLNNLKKFVFLFISPGEKLLLLFIEPIGYFN